MNIFKNISGWYKQSMLTNPLRTILIIALAVRLVAAFYAKGYGMHDDHFLVLEASQSWADGTDFDNWLPKNQANPKPEGHSFLYVGIHYVLMTVIKAAGITNPDAKALIIRLLHVLLSLIVVSTGYKIALKLAGQKSANQVGILLALLWFMPFLAVRNLVEIVAIPFLMLGIWTILDAPDRKKPLMWMFWGGMILGIAFSIRFQTILFIGGAGLALLIGKKWKEAFTMGFGALLSIFMVQGIVDIFIWGQPFAELTQYVMYNIINKNNYGYNNYLMYPEVILGILIPPVSIFLVFGFFRTWKKYLLIFLPTIIFFAFHEYFPNKQERFILTIIPLIIVTGVIGWNEFYTKSVYWGKHPLFLKRSFTFFWILNFLLLPFMSTAYSKKSRIEAMLYLHPQREKIQTLLLENNNRNDTEFIPLFYLGKWVNVYQYCPSFEFADSIETLRTTAYQRKIKSLEYITSQPSRIPQYILFYDDKNLEQRVASLKTVFPGLTYETTIEPGTLDKLLYKLNPGGNRNQVIYIYKNGGI
jgi:hypothetical protein